VHIVIAEVRIEPCSEAGAKLFERLSKEKVKATRHPPPPPRRKGNRGRKGRKKGSR
jgi:hypothetical protein